MESSKKVGFMMDFYPERAEHCSEGGERCTLDGDWIKLDEILNLLLVMGVDWKQFLSFPGRVKQAKLPGILLSEIFLIVSLKIPTKYRFLNKYKHFFYCIITMYYWLPELFLTIFASNWKSWVFSFGAICGKSQPTNY